MKLNLKFVTKITSGIEDNEIIFLKQKNLKINNLKPVTKTIFSSRLFNERKFLKKEYNNKTYIFVNCTNSKISLDFEKIGSKLYVFLKDNKIENSIIRDSNNSLTNIQIEKILHGVQLKSYNFNIYKTSKEKNDANININIVGKKTKQTNLIRVRLNALLQGVFLTRDLVSEPGNILHPDEYARRITKLRRLGLKVNVYDQKKLKKLGFNALLGVGQASIRGSYMVTI